MPDELYLHTRRHGDMTSKLVLFDIDGTLSPQGKFLARFPASVSEVLGSIVGVDGIDTTAKTDLGLTIEFASRASPAVPLSEIYENVGHMLAAQEDYFIRRQISQTELTRFEGTHELLSALRDRGHVLGIVTGNTRRIAEIKLEKIGLREFFSVFATGELSVGRTDLIEHAIKEAGITSQSDMSRGDVVYIADTPSDMRVGRNAGVMVIGVANGHFSRAGLMAEAPDFAFASFLDTGKVIESIESKRRRIGRGYSLVITPPEPIAGIAAGINIELSKRYGVPTFPPHTTIAGPVHDKDFFLDASRKLDGRLPQISVTFERVESKDEYFRELAFMARLTPELNRVNRMASEAYGKQNIQSYRPTMSVLYAYFPAKDFEVIGAQAQSALKVPFGYTAHKAELWSTVGPVENWHKIGEMLLRGAGQRTRMARRLA